MRKIFSSLAVACGLILALGLTACSNAGPTKVVDDALSALKEGDVEELMDCICMNNLPQGVDSWRDLQDDLPEDIRHDMKAVRSAVPLIRHMLNDVTWRFDGVERTGDEAVVTVKMKRGDEDEIESRVKVAKDRRGEWKIKSMGDLL